MIFCVHRTNSSKVFTKMKRRQRQAASKAEETDESDNDYESVMEAQDVSERHISRPDHPLRVIDFARYIGTSHQIASFSSRKLIFRHCVLFPRCTVRIYDEETDFKFGIDTERK